jgi:hypothetical protein
MTTKKLVFAGSGPGSPWAILGEVTGRILRNYGYDVEIIRRPGYRNIVAMGEGEADIGGTTVHMAMDALAGSTADGRQWPSIRRIAVVDRPHWHAVAVRRSTGITSLDQVAERKYPLRILARKDRLVQRLFELHGFSFEDIESWGGRIYELLIPAEEIRRGGRNPDSKSPSELVKGGYVDMIISQCYNSLGEFGTFWRQATSIMDLRFLSLREDVISTLCNEFGHDREVLPALTFEGVDEDVVTLGDFGLVVYCREETDDALVYLIAQAFDEHSREFVRTRHQFSYNPRHSVVENGFPLHPAAARYYQEQGLLKIAGSEVPA